MSKWIKDLNIQNPTKGSRGDRRWTLLFIGDRSKTIAFNHLKAAVIITILIILALTGFSIGLGYLYRDALVDIRTLSDKIDTLDQNVISLKDEKDILIARLVMAESRVDGSLSNKGRNLPSNPADTPLTEEPAPNVSRLPAVSQSPEEETATTAAENDKAVYHKVESGDSLYLISLSYGVSIDLLRKYNDLQEGHMIHPGQMLVIKPGTDAETVASAKPAPTPKRVAPKPDEQPVVKEPGPGMKVAVEKMTTVFEPGANLLRVEYVIRNTGEKTQPINGQTVVILKNENNDPKGWLVLPSVPLESDRPKGTEGYFFSIYNYRTIRFKVNDQADTDRFTAAIVYVFSKTGDLVLEKQFTVSIKGANTPQSDT